MIRAEYISTILILSLKIEKGIFGLVQILPEFTNMNLNLKAILTVDLLIIPIMKD